MASLWTSLVRRPMMAIERSVEARTESLEWWCVDEDGRENVQVLYL
jgi:hypothetical protein